MTHAKRGSIASLSKKIVGYNLSETIEAADSLSASKKHLSLSEKIPA
jgi:hypothetical protein